MEKIKAFFAKQSLGFYIGAPATLLLFVGTILFAASGNMPYFNDYNALVPLCGILAVIVAIGLLAARQFVKIHHLEALWIVVVVLAAIATVIVISPRIEALAIVLGSDLERGNAAAQSAMNTFIAGLVFVVVGAIAAIVASFFKVTKETK